MRTLIVQSYRTSGVARWLDRCMQAARGWAQMRGHDYRFIDDRLFELVPAWYRERCGRQILPVTDLARLLVLRRALTEEGYERAAWLDADLLVFDPARFFVEAPAGYAFAQECWLAEQADSTVARFRRVNNSVVVMTRQQPVLDFLIHACQQIVAQRTPEQLQHHSAGTALLTALAVAMPLPVLQGAAMFSPLVVRELAARKDRCARILAEEARFPLAAANLCASLVGSGPAAASVEETERVVEDLLATRGEAVNRFLAVGGGNRT